MNINAKQGDKVVFTCKGGFDGDQFNAKQHLIIGNIYEVEHVSVGGFHSSVKIVGIEKLFNTALFDDYVEPDSKPNEDQMTLRDQFAMAALNALISKEYKDDVKRGAKGVPIFAQYAYEYADAMIEARKQK